MLQLCKVTATLLISSARAACNEDLLRREGVTFCVNVTRQQPFPGLQQIRGIRVPVFDDPAEDLYRYFEQCSDAIEEAVKSGGKCLVYCKNGRSRSAAICTAYLMRHRKLPLKAAFEVACEIIYWDIRKLQEASKLDYNYVYHKTLNVERNTDVFYRTVEQINTSVI